tara:strand:+ start:206365 stop:207300 length:936 start_codon:yes stop_codon:yes gene_type:complete
MDSFTTIFSPRGAGKVTSFWGHFYWSLLLKIHYKRPIHRVLEVFGPLFTILTVICWYSLIYLGWFLVFASNEDSVIINTTKANTTLSEKFYFLGATMATTGYGDTVPSALPWTALGNFSATGTTLLLTISLSYVLPVLQAAQKRRVLGQTVFAQGSNVLEFYDSATRSDGDFDQIILNIAKLLQVHSDNHKIYPVLHFFHNSNKDNSSSIAVLMVTDALFISQFRKEGLSLSKTTINSLNNAVKTYIQHKFNTEDHKTDFEEDLIKFKCILDKLKYQASPQELKARLRKYREVRVPLLSICYNDGWGQEDQ